MKSRKALWRAGSAAATIAFAVTLVVSAGPADAATERRQTLSGTATGGTTRTPVAPAPGEVQLLRGFDLRYVNADHHIKTIGVLPQSGGALGVTFEDRNGDDQMQYTVNLTKVRLPGTISPAVAGGTCGGGTCSFPLQAPPSDQYIFFLRGFRLTYLSDGGEAVPYDNCNDFAGCDHHLSVVGIKRQGSNNRVEVTYQDKNGDDDYYAEVAYSWVPRSLIQRFVIVNGSVGHTGTQHKNTTTGVAAMTGFRIEYNRIANGTGGTYLPDHHIKRLGYQITDTGVDVAFQDKDPSTNWKYQVNYISFR
jgi:hypothetical protein